MQTVGLVRAKPIKATRVAWVLAVVVVAVFAAVATTLRGATDSGKGVFQASDQWAMIVLGVLGALGILMFTRPRVEADERGIRVRNLVGGYDLPWDVVRSVQFTRGAPWASLELRDDDLIPMMAIQATDKKYALEAIRGLRTLLAAAQAGEEPGA
ncbi:MAG: PH domain-containing protein [Actinobacteria bacterium]|nr:MAG: PH domain-containing protein [Actinomycetota bacterium]